MMLLQHVLAPFARRNRAALLALLPLIVLALGMPVFWIVFTAHLSTGAVALFFPLAILVAPSILGLGAGLLSGVITSLGGLSYMLWNGATPRRWLFVLPGPPIAIACLAMGSSVRDFLAQRSGEGLDPEWAALALLAHGAFPVVTLLMVLLVVWPQREPSTHSGWRGLVGAVGVVLVWAVFWSALGPAQAWARDHIASRSVSLADEVPSDNGNAIVQAVCAGRLAEVSALLQDKKAPLGEGTVDALVSTCLKSNTSRFYAERVATVLDATLAFEARSGVPSQPGCSPRQQALLSTVYQEGFADIALQAFRDRGLPITCPATAGDSAQPVWWRAAHGQGLNLEKLQRLQAWGIDLAQKDAAGLDLIGANPNYVVSNLDDASLLLLVQQGLRDQAGGKTPHVLVIEVMKRRFGVASSSPDSPDLARLYALVGDPSDAQLREVMGRAPHMLRPYSDSMRAQQKRLQDYVYSRVGLQLSP